VISKSKLYDKLDRLEEELVERLVPHLQVAASGNNDLVFCVKGYHSFSELKKDSDAVTAELTEIGAEILALRKKLEEPSEGTVAERICWYCREWGKANNHRRSNAQDLAKQFLEEIEKL